ncbi:hypothetical protein [Ponticaulis profundi]|uniref:Uncharacterized protein n=1 Tax=Ponticaulis profundi TaxID=2665222 RepID=A0ABW1S909_9PROT
MTSISSMIKVVPALIASSLLMLGNSVASAHDISLHPVPGGRGLQQGEDYPRCPEQDRVLSLQLTMNQDIGEVPAVVCTYMNMYVSNTRAYLRFYDKKGDFRSAEKAVQAVINEHSNLLSGFKRLEEASKTCDLQLELVTNAKRYDVSVFEEPEKIRNSGKTACAAYSNLSNIKAPDAPDPVWQDYVVISAQKLDDWIAVVVVYGDLDEFGTDAMLASSMGLMAQQMPQPDWLREFIAPMLSY